MLLIQHLVNKQIIPDSNLHSFLFSGHKISDCIHEQNLGDYVHAFVGRGGRAGTRGLAKNSNKFFSIVIIGPLVLDFVTEV